MEPGRFIEDFIRLRLNTLYVAPLHLAYLMIFMVQTDTARQNLLCFFCSNPLNYNLIKELISLNSSTLYSLKVVARF